MADDCASHTVWIDSAAALVAPGFTNNEPRTMNHELRGTFLMTARLPSILAVAMLVSACASPPRSDLAPENAAEFEPHPAEYLRVVKYAQIDVAAPPRTVAECAHDTLLNMDVSNSWQAYSTIPSIQEINGQLTLVGRAPFAYTYAVTFDGNGDGTHAVIYRGMEYDHGRILGDTIVGIVRDCG